MSYSSDEEWTHVISTTNRGRQTRRRVRRSTSVTMAAGGPTADQIATALRDLITTSATATAPAPVARKKLSKWGTEGLNISDPSFSKLHSKEQKFEESTRQKYDLEKEKFLNFSTNLVEKVNRLYAKNDFTMPDSSPTPANCFVLTEYTKLSRANIEASRNTRWPDTNPTFTIQSQWDQFTDTQIKSSTVGQYIHASLSEDAKRQLSADEDLFQVKDLDGNIFFDGPSYFWKIAAIVDPDNDSLVDSERMKLKNLNVKNFGYSIIQMLAEFKNIMKRIGELGGSYSSDEQFLDFWTAVATMKEKGFAAYVTHQKDIYRDTPKHARPTIDDYIHKFTKKETAMKEDKKWNVASPEEQMIMALVSVLDSQSKSDNKKPKHTETESKKATETTSDKADKEPLSKEEKAKLKESRIPAWKKQSPKDDEPTEKEVDGRTYYWCTKCRDGKGMWALHKVHNNNFNSRSKKQTEKSVRFSNNTKDNSATQNTNTESDSGDESDSSPSIKVNKALLKNARAYLAQFTDFQTGGA
jgi:hypothetical protein